MAADPPTFMINDLARIQASGQHQVKKTEICRRWSDNENWRRVGRTPGGGGRSAVLALRLP